MRSYELLFIVRPGLDEEATATLMERLQNAVRDNGGKILRIESVGRRKLAYPISKETEGHYTILQAEMDQTVIRQVERLITLSEDVIRHLLVRMDDEDAEPEAEERDRSSDDRRGEGGRRRFNRSRNVCRMCADGVEQVDYKDINTLRHYVSDHGRILPRRRSKTCARHQRMVSVAVKRARQVALLPYSAVHVREDGS